MKNDRSKLIKKQLIRQFYRGNRTRLFFAVLASVLNAGVNLVISWALQQVLDAATGNEGTLAFGTLLWIAGGMLACITVLSFMMYHSKPAFIATAARQYKDHAMSELSKKGINAFRGENTSLYTSALSNDIAAIEKNYLESIFSLVTNMLLFVGAFAMMLWYSPLLTLVTLGLSVLPVVASLLTGNRIAGAEKSLSDRNESYLATLKDCLTGFSVIKSFKAEAQILSLMARSNAQTAQAKTVRDKIAVAVSAIGTIAGTITQFGVFLFSAYLALSGRDITPGVIIVFVQLINFVIMPIGEVPGLLAGRKAALALIDKLADALADNSQKEGTLAPNTLAKGITLRDVSFSYEEGKPVLRGINTCFEAGKSYAIVGASGSGKSTLLNLLLGAEGHSGEVLFDGADIRQISSEALYDLVSVIHQNVFIFNASIRDNITMFSDFSQDEVERAIELSGLRELIREKGEHYLCGENGSGLSGGEKQRISIARSLLRRSSVLLVDEATAALDAQTAYQVSSAILDLDGMTRIVITHSLDESLLGRYNSILALKSGVIAESGTFDELMEQKGYFYSLYTVSQ